MHNNMTNNCPSHIGSMCTKGYAILSSMKSSLDERWYVQGTIPGQVLNRRMQFVSL